MSYSEFWPGVDDDTARKVTGTLLPAIASTAVTNAGPDPALPGALGYLPFTGAVEGLGGFGGLMYNLARAGASKYGINLPEAPLLDQAGQHWANTNEQIFQQLPHYTPTPEEAPDYDKGRAMGTMLGNAVPVAPAVPGLGALGFIAPTLSHPVANAAIAGTVGPALASLLEPSQAQAAETQPPKDFFSNFTPDKPQAQTAPFDFSGFTPPNEGAPAPTFGEEGKGDFTWGQIAGAFGIILGSLVAGKYMHGLSGGITNAIRDERMNDPTFLQKSNDYNNQQIQAQTGQQISGPDGTRVLPPRPSGGTARDVAVAAQTQTLDANALMNDYIKITSGNPADADKLSHQFGITFDPSAQQSSVREFLNTGVDRTTNVSIPQPARLYRDIEALDPMQQKVLNDGLNAANEMDNRNKGYAQGNTSPAHDFPNVADQDLVNYTQTMLRDPVLSDIANRYWDVGKGMMEIAQARGFITPSEFRDITNQHPNYVPEVDLNGRITHALGPRNLSPRAGIDQVNTTAWSAMAQHIESLHDQMNMNDFRRAITDHRMDVQNQYPNSAQSLKEVQNPYPQNAPTMYATAGPSGAPVRDPIYSVRRGTGIKFYRDDDPDLFDATTGNSHARAQIAFNTLGTMRRLFTMGTTGVWSAATGRLFPITHDIRVAIQAPINRPQGMAASLSDLAMQKLTGGRVGQRIIPDPTNLAGAAYSFGRGMFDDMALHLSNFMDPTNPHPITQRLKSFITPAMQKQMSESLMRYYTGTVTHEMRAVGAQGMGIPYQTRLPAFSRQGGMADQTPRLASGAIAPGLFLSGGKLGTIAPTYFKVQQAVEHIYGQLMDASQQYFYRLNKFKGDVDPNTLTYETRSLVGNPTTYGKGTAASFVRQTIPYANISAQGKARIYRSMREAPIGSSAAMVGQLGSLAMASIFTAMQNPQTMNYLQNMITTQARAANAIIFGNADPSLHTEIPLLHDLRMPYALILDGVSKIVNLMAMQHDPVSFDSAYAMMKDFFSDHIENSTETSGLHGLADSFGMDFPSWINGLIELGKGGSLRIDLERMVNDAKQGRFGLNTFSIAPGQDKPLPNHPTGDTLFDGVNAKVYRTALSDFFGSAAGIMDQITGFHRYYHQSGDFWNSLGQTGKDWLQSMMDQNPALNNVLWENPARESMRPPIVESVERQLTQMRATSGSKSAELQEGTTGGKFPLPVTGQPEGDFTIPKDPAMRQIYQATGAQYKWIEATTMNEINQIKKQMVDGANQAMDKREQREWLNNQTRVIADKYRAIQAQIDDLNAKLSNRFGRSINVTGRVNWKGTLDENFPPS